MGEPSRKKFKNMWPRDVSFPGWKAYREDVGTALSQLLNVVVFFGEPDESTSKRAARQPEDPFWNQLGRILGKEHLDWASQPRKPRSK